MIAVGYVRRSSKKEGNSQISIEVQRQAIGRYCDKQGLSLACIVTHNGISGTKRKRYEHIETALKDTKAQALVVYNLDRLSRDSAGLSDHLKQWTARGIEVHETETGILDLRKAINRFMVGVRGQMDELYADLIGEKTCDALAALRSGGQRWCHHAPFGYQWLGDTAVVCEEEQRARAIINRCGIAGLGRVRTLGRLRAEGYLGRASLSTIQKLLEENDAS